MTEDPDRYLVPAREGRFDLQAKRSRFLAVAAHTRQVAAGEDLVRGLKRRYHDAAHHCFAWRIAEEERYHDDGEPAGTAGRPMLDAIHAAGVSFVTVVVTRYFGGIKLGTGGLARAYADAAKGALESAGADERFRQLSLNVSLEHADTSTVHHVAGRFGARILGAAYGERVAMQLEVRASRRDALSTALVEATHGRVEIHGTTV